MLDLLRAAGKFTKSSLNMDLKRDLNWFIHFLPKFNGKAFISQRSITEEIELGASLQGLVARWVHQVYTISIPLGFKNFTIVHLEMMNILVVAVVSVLNSGKTRDLTPAIGRNILWKQLRLIFLLKLSISWVKSMK